MSSGLRAPSFNRTEAEKLAMKSMTEDVFIDYLCGKCFKIEMSKHGISEHYDIDNSVKALLRIGQRMRTMFIDTTANDYEWVCALSIPLLTLL